MNKRPTAPNGLLPVRPRGKHEIEAAGGWIVACGNYNEYGCMPDVARDYIIETLNAAAPPAAPLDMRAKTLLDELEYWSFFHGGVRKWRFDEVQPSLERAMANLRAIVGSERPENWPLHEPYPRAARLSDSQEPSGE